MRRVVILHEIQNEGFMRAILFDFALYKLWTLLGWRLDIDGLVGKKDCSSHRFEEVWASAASRDPQTCHANGAWGSGDGVQYVGSLSRLPKVDNMLR